MKRSFTAVLMLLLVSLPGLAAAGDWNLAKNVKRLENVAPDYKDDKDIDRKFIEVLDLTEKTRKDSEVYEEAKKIAANPALAQSKYTDSFLYYMLVKSLGVVKSGTSEVDYWLGLLKSHEKSHHLLAAQLVRLRLLPKNSPDVRRDVQLIVDWLKAQKPEFRVRPAEYTGNMLLGYKPRNNFAEGDGVKLYALSHYKDSVAPLPGFMEDEAYIALLDRIKDGREDILTEMSALYKKKGKKKEAADTLYQLALLKIAAKDFEKAKTVLDEALGQNKEHAEARKERDRIKLELAYKSLAPAAPAAAPETPAPSQAKDEAPGIPEHLNKVEGYLTPADRVITEAELHGKSNAELRVMRNEVYARHGRVFQAGDLHTYFSQRPWYRQNPSYSDTLLTEVDSQNIKVIQEFEGRAR